MSRRFRPTDAFVDESIRGQRYLMGCVLIEARHLTATRAAIGALPTRSRRRHFNNEVDAQKRILLASIAELPVRAFVAVCHRRHGITEFVAREACLAALVSEVQSQRVDRLVLESRQDDSEDARIISKLRQPEPPLVFEHRTAGVKPCWASPTESRGWPVQERTAGTHRAARAASASFGRNGAEPGSPTYGWATGSTSKGPCPRQDRYAPRVCHSQAGLRSRQ